MNTNLTTFTTAQIESMKFADLAIEYNKFAVELGLPTIKKFADKSKGQARLIAIQNEYSEECSQQKAAQTEVKKPVKATKADLYHLFGKNAKQPKTTFDMTATLVTVKEAGKEGTIENSLHAAIASGANTVQEVIDWIMVNHKRPRAEQVDQQYVIHNIRWFIRKGHIAITK